MAKQDKQPPPRRLEPVPPTQPRRLEGDALFAWATMQTEARQLSQQMQGFVQMQAQELGFDPEQEGIDPGGYIRPLQREPLTLQVPQNAPEAPVEPPQPGE